MQKHTRRQRGGAIIKVCEKTHTGFIKMESNASGIDITYDDDTHMFKIGTQPTIAELKTFNGKNRYERAVYVLELIGQTDPTQLNWYNFALFAPIYCHNYTHPQCSQMRDFLGKYYTSKDIDKNGAVEGRTIGTSIISGNEQAAHNTYLTDIDTQFPPVAAPVAEVPKMSPNVLMINDSIIAYKNNKGVMRSVTVDRSKTDYEFDNFIIPNNDHDDISGKLKVEFVGNPVVTRFTLELSMSSITPKLIECVEGIEDLVVNIENVSNSFSAMVITGTLTEQRVGEKKSTYDFSSFVLNFVENYQDCLVAGQFVVSDPQVYIRLITKHIAECSQRIDTEKGFLPEQKMLLKAVLTAFQSRFNDLKQTKNLEALKTLHEEVNTFRNGDLFQAEQTSLKNASLAAQMGVLSVRGPGAGAAS
jgi:hypothetical protein